MVLCTPLLFILTNAAAAFTPANTCLHLELVSDALAAAAILPSLAAEASPLHSAMTLAMLSDDDEIR